MAEQPEMHARAKIGEKGRVVIPADMREKLGLKAGDIVEITVVDNELRVIGLRKRIEAMQKRLAKYKKPGISAVDEFIAERRAEARREEAEYQELKLG